MAKLSFIKTDSKRETEGIWFDYKMGIRLLVARLGNPNYTAARDKAIERWRRQHRSREMTIMEILEVQKPAVAKHILLGWENIEDESGVTVEYSTEQALDWFNDPEMKIFYDDVLAFSSDNESYMKEREDDLAGNSESSSSGSSPMES